MDSLFNTIINKYNIKLTDRPADKYGRYIDNFIRIKVTNMDLIGFNTFLLEILPVLKGDVRFNEIERTRSGGISISNQAPHKRVLAYDVIQTRTRIELTVLLGDYSFRVALTHTSKDDLSDEKVDVSGKQGLNYLENRLKENGIALRDYKLDKDTGYKTKQTIDKPRIALEDIHLDMTYENVHHMDISSAYPAGVVKEFPEFLPTIQDIFDKRKTEPQNKLLLDVAIGRMQSKFEGYAYAHISKAGIDWCANEVDEMVKYLKKQGRKVLLTNTDGVWYQGEPLEMPSAGQLGMWRNDKLNCKRFRAKSKGAYEYIDSDNNYKPVIRGRTLLDTAKPRSEWRWGDIYHKTAEEIITYTFNKDAFQVEQTVISYKELERINHWI